ncbi:MAG: hypothetical protein PHO27_12935 [Sulfuricurvum sp.]|nr:hypothetical protein [Sulfuricurvum sp.]
MWVNFPLRKDVGEQPNDKDVPPEVTRGDFILYHGTSDIAAASIVKSKTIKPDDIGSVGIATTPIAAKTYATHKIGKGNKPTILKMVIDKDWMVKQQVRHEIGGHGHSAFLIQPDYKLGIKATIPSEAIKSIEVCKERRKK